MTFGEAGRFRAKSALRMAQLSAMMAAAITLAAVLGITSAAASTLVQTTNGWVQGKSVGSVDQWLGIRYAASPDRSWPLGAAETLQDPMVRRRIPTTRRNLALPVRRTSPSSATRSRFRYRQTRSRFLAAPTARTAFFSTSMFQPIGAMTAASRCRSSSGSMVARTNTARAAPTIRRPSSPKATSSSSRSTIA